jgi:hypothetical protein
MCSNVGAVPFHDLRRFGVFLPDEYHESYPFQVRNPGHNLNAACMDL